VEKLGLLEAEVPEYPTASPPRSPRPAMPSPPRVSEVSVPVGGPAFAIPRFWAPPRPITEIGEAEAALARRYFSDGVPTTAALEPLMAELGLSKYLAAPMLKRMQRAGAVTPESALKYFARFRIEDPVHNFFYLVKDDANDFIEKRDLRDCIWNLIQTNPGLEFLQDTPEFQERYCDTVIVRIMYCLDRMRLGKITLSELRRGKPDVVALWRQLDTTDDINKVRDYFSYEHFYVLYCKFWELDTDHDFLLDKEDLLKYDGHAFSRKAIDRIFSEVPMTFTSGRPGKMAYEDFCWFLIADEDKTTDRSLELFFSLVDLDGDGRISRAEMEHFYCEQEQRLECLNHEVVKFPDVLSQMCDLLDKKEAVYCLDDFKRKREISGVFFSILLSLNKFLSYEQRDPFAQKQDRLECPDFSDWDRYCQAEYVRLAMEEDEQNEADLSHNVGMMVDAS
jgi:serine/threonine-protein phosphatase 2A regulatory subunit B''